MSGTWNDDRVERLRKLWDSGFSASQIAAKMSAQFAYAFTRNMVISKCNRLGLTRDPHKNLINRRKSYGNYKRRKAVGEPKQPTARQSALAAVMQRVPREPVPAEENPADFPDRVKLQDLNSRSCRWPIGDPQHDDFGFCGKQSVTGLPYCEHHARRAYRPPETVQRAPRPVRVPTFSDLEKV